MHHLLRTICICLLIATAIPGDLHAQWVQTDGPYGGDINCFAMSGSTLFAGTGRGVYRSTDYGIN